MKEGLTVCICSAICYALGFFLALDVKKDIESDKPIKLSYTLSCEDGKCDTTYKASTR